MGVNHLRKSAEAVAAGLSFDEVHLWHGDPFCLLDEEILSDDEKQRASRYRFSEHRAAFVGSRCVTRTLLSAYLNCADQDIRFEYGLCGKPAIAQPSTGLTFNLSHSGNRMLIAIAHRYQLGVDIELSDAAYRFADAIMSILDNVERRAVERTPLRFREELLLRYWTQKEACVKAIGVGLSLPLTSLHVQFDKAGRTLIRANRSHNNLYFHGRDIDCGPSHKGALVVDEGAACSHYSF